MNTSLAQRIEDVPPRVSRAAGSHAFALPFAPQPFFSPVIIRVATAADGPSLKRLAELDSAQAPEGETLIGELHGRPVAAVSLSDGMTIADPFVLAGPILDLVRLRASQLGPESRPRRIWSLRNQH